jgi:ribosomal protein S18 acetylase RimI-like enzyme
VGRLIVAPDLQGRGIGTRLIAELERRLGSEVARFEVFTGHRSARNLDLYRRLGYREIGRRRAGEAVELVFLEKPAPEA